MPGAGLQVSIGYKEVPMGWDKTNVFSVFLHDAACGRRRMSPSARHKLALCVRNPGFPGRKLVFPQRRSRRGNVIISFRGKEGRGEEGSS